MFLQALLNPVGRLDETKFKVLLVLSQCKMNEA